MTESPKSSPDTPNAVRHIDALPVGTRLAEFEILGLLGVGGFGMVYKAFDHSLHRTVAIKEYMPAALVTRAKDGALWTRSSSDEPAFQAGLHSFVDEARMLAQFDHPSLVKVFRFWEMQNTAYMVMPLYHGMTFKQARTQMRSPPPEAWLREMLWSVLGALRVLHDSNTLHRDISPDNIFLQYAGPPVLLDLGASRHAINDRDRKHTAVLKVNYAPIEQYSDGTDEGSTALEQGPWSDLYSLGAVVHGCLCNDTPLPATLRSLRDRMVPFSRVAKTVRKQFGQEYSAPFVEAIGQALKLQPEERPQSIDAFLQIMQMTTAPADIAHFDFRNALGDIWVEPTDQPDLAAGATTVDLTGQQRSKAVSTSVPLGAAAAAVAPRIDALQSSACASPADGNSVETAPPINPTPQSDEVDTVFLNVDSVQPDELLHGVPPSQSLARVLESTQTVAQQEIPDKKKPWIGIVVALVLLATGVTVIGLRGSPPPTPVKSTQSAPDRIITELKTSPEPRAQNEPAQSTDLPADDGAAASNLVREPETPPAFVSGDDPRAASASAAAAAAAAAAARTRARVRKTLPTPESPTISETPPVTESAPPARPAPAPAPAARKPLQSAICEGTNILTRSSCLRQECASSANRSLSACVEFRRNMEPLERNQFAN